MARDTIPLSSLKETFGDIGSNVVWSIFFAILGVVAPDLRIATIAAIKSNEEVSQGVLGVFFSGVEWLLGLWDMPDVATKLKDAFLGQSAQSVVRYALKHQNEVPDGHKVMSADDLIANLRETVGSTKFRGRLEQSMPKFAFARKFRAWSGDKDVLEVNYEHLSYLELEDQDLLKRWLMRWALFPADVEDDVRRIDHILTPTIVRALLDMSPEQCVATIKQMAPNTAREAIEHAAHEALNPINSFFHGLRVSIRQSQIKLDVLEGRNPVSPEIPPLNAPAVTPADAWSRIMRPSFEQVLEFGTQQ